MHRPHSLLQLVWREARETLQMPSEGEERLMKTIRELVKENGCVPLLVQECDEDAELPQLFFVVGIAPNGWAIGWDRVGKPDYHRADFNNWQLPNERAVIPHEVVTERIVHENL